jgi:hypothetical protein
MVCVLSSAINYLTGYIYIVRRQIALFFKTYSMFYVLYKLCRSTTWGIGNLCRFIDIHMKQFGLLAPKDFKNIMTFSVPNVDYSRNASYVLIWISTFVLIHSTTDYLILKKTVSLLAIIWTLQFLCLTLYLLYLRWY